MVFRQRLRQIKKQFESCSHASALIISSNPEVLCSRDTHYPFRQNSDFYYLTGSQARNVTLLLNSKRKYPVLFAGKPDPKREIWEGKGPNLKLLAKDLGAELILTDTALSDLMSELKGIETLYHQNIVGTLSYQVASRLQAISAHERGSHPRSLSLAEVILEPMRKFKSKDEISAIVKACAVTNEGLLTILPLIRAGMAEAEIAHTLEYAFKLEGANAAFTTIVATGPSAATLHHTDYRRKLKKGDLVLIDCGAQLDMYCADITRVLPVSKHFSPIQRELYSIVLNAQKAAISAIKHKVQIKQVHAAAIEVISEGLLALKVLKGSIKTIIKQELYKEFFMHGIGHTLGIDVHDVGNVRSNSDAILEEGMVVTIEPGLYFQRPNGKIPPCGIRIEDDILVTRYGSEILSAGFPKEPDQIEELL